MQSLFVLLLCVLGALVASFIGVVAGRLNTGESFSTGRSRCDACGRPLPLLMLVPILSYIAARGRAQCCGARLDPFSPLSELLLGALFALSYLQLGAAFPLLFFLVALTLLLALVLYDLKHQILPPGLLSLFVAVSAVTGFLLSSSFSTFTVPLITAALIAAFLALIHFFSKGRAMGLADAPLAFGLALLTGPAALTGFIFSFWVGAVVGIVVLLGRPSGSRMGVEVPFAPFLAAGFLLAYFTQWNLFSLIIGIPGI